MKKSSYCAYKDIKIHITILSQLKILKKKQTFMSFDYKTHNAGQDLWQVILSHVRNIKIGTAVDKSILGAHI